MARYRWCCWRCWRVPPNRCTATRLPRRWKPGGGVLAGKQSALYPVLRNLEAAGLLDSHVEPSMAGPPRRYYRINEQGRQVLARWLAAWEQTRDSVQSLIQGEA